MRLEFTRLILKDFKEYRGKHVLDLAGLGYGVHYVRGKNRVDALGSNGAGKSTLWDAFLWCLSGRTVRGLRGIDVRTWESAEHAMSRVDFFCDDEAHFVKRSTVKNGLWLDGKLASQEEIDRLIGLSIINIPHTIILGQKQELFFDLKPANKLEVLSETLHLDKWEERSKRARDKAKEIEADHDARVYGIAQLELLNETSRKGLERAKEAAAEWERERAKGDAKREAEQERLTKALTKTTAEAGPLDLAYDSAETELRAIRKDLIKKAAELEELNAKLQAAKLKAIDKENEYDTLRDIARGGVCPACGQEVAEDKKHAKEAKAKLRAAKDAMHIASDRVIVRETQIELMRKAIRIQREAEKAFGVKSDNAKDSLDHLTARIASIKQEIAVLKAQSRDDEVNPHSLMVTGIRKQIKETKETIAEENTIVAKLAKRAIRTKYWIDGFKQVRLYLLQETLEELQEVTQNMLPSLGLTGWIVEYAIERDTKAGTVSTGLTVTILKPGMTKGVRWEAWSGGEGQRLLIVGAMALSEVLLRRAGIECDLLVLDEPTRHMSKEGIAETVDYLIERGRDGQVFYVDHQVVESNRFASVITVEKDDDGAKIAIET